MARVYCSAGSEVLDSGHLKMPIVEKASPHLVCLSGPNLRKYLVAFQSPVGVLGGFSERGLPWYPDSPELSAGFVATSFPRTIHTRFPWKSQFLALQALVLGQEPRLASRDSSYGPIKFVIKEGRTLEGNPEPHLLRGRVSQAHLLGGRVGQPRPEP